MRRISILIFIAGLVIFVLSTSQYFDAHPDWVLFLKELAFAFLIAGILGYTIERVQRDEFVKLVEKEREVLKKDVFLYAYGHNIPEEIREEIRDKILREPFYRRDLKLEWEFSELKDNPEYLRIRKRVSYMLVNNSARPQAYEFTFTSVGAAILGHVEQTEFAILRVQLADGELTWRSEDMRKEQSDKHPHMKKFSATFNIKAQEVVPVYYTLNEIRKNADEANFSARHPVAGQTKVVLFIRSPLHLDITAVCKAVPLKHAPDSDPPSIYSFYVQGGLMPFQGISISWSSKEEPEPN